MAQTKLPPLNALRAFEAAARLQSISRAADEIHVTHGAVSHQVKSLEAFVGVPLLERKGRGVIATPAGRRLAERAGQAFERIAEVAADLGRRDDPGRLTVSTLPSLATRWLMPRIGAFMESHPQFELNLHTSVSLVDFTRDEIDIAIRFGKGAWPNVRAERLMGDEYFAVCSPKLNRGALPKRPSDLKNYRLLRSDSEYWVPWFRAAKLDWPEPTKISVFDDASMLLLAAAQQQGIALTRRSIALPDLEAGTLVKLFDIAIPSIEAHWLVWPPHAEHYPKVVAFRKWVKQEARKSSVADSNRDEATRYR
jgi:LysR family glycine cleavage system transcriptional activator